jgi:hypothetical protein
MKISFFSALLAVAALGFSACSKTEPATANPGAAAQHKHEHHAPHGGTAVELGEELYHLELVRDASVGKLSAYVLDGELENFIRIPAPSIEIVATVAGQPQTLTLTAVANPATGEKVGDTSLFEATADWLKTTAEFDGVITAVEIKGTKFTAVAFNFPKGNEK